MEKQTITASIYSAMIKAAAANLKKHVQEVNDLNVFPIPDGDTGDNMLLTVSGGAEAAEGELLLGETAKKIADGMLLSARGNSGVITSQFFDGVACALDGMAEADVETFGKAFLSGVKQAYTSVITPVEGTILTVAREASQYAASMGADSAEEFLDAFIMEAKETLKRTPELLDVLKKAGVVDSGGAGLIYIAEGMRNSLGGEEDYGEEIAVSSAAQKIDINSFTEDSVLEFGYCTELLIRLTRAKTDVENFDVSVIIDYLKTVGNSVVAFKNGSIVKLHVHTMEPERVLSFCHRFGEFLTVKVENMSLQHNSIGEKKAMAEKKKYAVIETASGSGIKETFLSLGADAVVDGGQSMNPSANDFLCAFKKVNAEVIFVFPNNSNVILAAMQAAKMYTEADVRVIESKTVGEGHSALAMFDPDNKSTDEIEQEFYSAMEGVVTAEVSVCSRNTESDGFSLKEGDYIGFEGKKILACGKDRKQAAESLLGALDYTDKSSCIIFSGKDVSESEAENLKNYLGSSGCGLEIFTVSGGQSVHDYIIILE